MSPPRRRLSKEARREHLLDTAADLLLRDGLDALTMEGIGIEAGVSKTLGYAYFDNVDHVLTALRRRELGVLYERVEAAAEGATTLDDKVGATFAAYFEIVSERGLLLGELEQAMNARRISLEGSDGTNEFLAWLADLIDDEFSVGPRRAFAYAAIVASSANNHAAIWKMSRFSRTHIHRTAVHFALGGLRAAVDADDGQTNGRCDEPT